VSYGARIAPFSLFQPNVPNPHIERTLNRAGGDKTRAAELMGLSLSTLYRKIEKLGIES